MKSGLNRLPRLRVRRADGTSERHDGHFRASVGRGDVLEVRVPSGGGFGDPLARDPARVLADLAEGKVTPAHARAAYGVIPRGAPAVVDEVETRALRARMGSTAS